MEKTMIQGMIAKKLIDFALKKIMEKKEVKKLRKYVEEENDLDIITKAHGKALDKYGKTLEEIQIDLAIVKKNSHEPIFNKKDYKDILKRLKKLERKK